MHYRVSGVRIAVSFPPSQDGRSGVGGLGAGGLGVGGLGVGGLGVGRLGVGGLGVPILAVAQRGTGGCTLVILGHAFFGCGAFRHRRVLIMTSIVFSKFQLYKVLFGSPLMAGEIYHFLLKFL